MLEASKAEAVPNPFYISTTTSILESHPRTLKHDDTFAVFDHYGDVSSHSGSAEGVFHKDTRFLSDLRVLVDGQRPLLLSSNVADNNALLTADLTNPDLFAGADLKLPRDTIQIVRSKFLWAGASYERLGVRSFGAGAQVFEFVFQFSADFADIFELRGHIRKRRGKIEAKVDESGVISCTMVSTASFAAPPSNSTRRRRRSTKAALVSWSSSAPASAAPCS